MRSGCRRVRSTFDGYTVILTRETADNARFARDLVGADEIVELPCVRVEPLADSTALAMALAPLGAGDWLVVTSRHGADAVARCGAPLARVAAIGEATAERLRHLGIAVAFTPSAASGERLARELPGPGGTVLLARSDRALGDLPRILRERGFTVREVVSYRTVAGAYGAVGRVRSLLASERRAAVVFHSPSAVEGFLLAVEPSLLARAAIFVSGEATARAIREHVGVPVSQLEEVGHVAHR
jgi:uroporphyrinogen III methyltransferase/synthase